MSDRPPLDPAGDHILFGATAARRHLALHGVPRRSSAGMTLEELQTAIEERMPEDANPVAVTTDKGFQQVANRIDVYMRSVVNGPIDPGKPIVGRSGAETLLREHASDVPDGEPLIALADAIAGLRGERPLVVEDETLNGYRAEVYAAIMTVPTGRPKQRVKTNG